MNEIETQLAELIGSIAESPRRATPGAQILAANLLARLGQQPELTPARNIFEHDLPASWLGQMLMNALADPDISGPGDLQDLNFFRDMAQHMGPDWCQANYHAAVFMTKVC